MNQTPPETTYSVAQAAKRLETSIPRINRLIGTGRLIAEWGKGPHGSWGWRIQESVLRAFEQGHELGSFVSRVQATVGRLIPDAENRILIERVWELGDWRFGEFELSREAFSYWLTEANRSEHLILAQCESREGLDAELVRASAVSDRGSVFHFIKQS